MKPFYTAYAKSIDGTTFYFVKKYKIFPEYQTVPPILESYAMHTNFGQACKIAQIYDKEIMQQLIKEMENNPASSKVLPLYPAVSEVYKLKRRQITFPSLLHLLRLG